MHTDSVQESAPKRRRRPYGLLWALPVLLIYGSVYFVSNSENKGEVVSNAADVLARDVPTTTIETVETPYYTLEYLSDFTMQKNPARTPDVLDLQVLLSHSEKNNPGSIRASLAVETLPDGGIKEMSPYLLAAAYPDKYTIEERTVSGMKQYLLTKYDDDSVKIVLIPHNTVVLVMALASQTIGDKPKYDVFIERAVSTLIWK